MGCVGVILFETCESHSLIYYYPEFFSVIKSIFLSGEFLHQ